MSKIDSLLKYDKKPGKASKSKSQVKSKMEYLLRILNRLENNDLVTVRDLKEEFSCSERTAYRYIQTLQDVFPIYYDRQKSCYLFAEGYCLRKPDMSFEETIAFAMAKKLLGNMGTEMERCLNNLEQKLSAKKRELPKHIILSGNRSSPMVSNYLGTLYNAILNYQRVEMAYNALYSEEVSQRTVEPCYLFIQDNLWYLRAYCSEKKELRTFALDRMLSLKAIDEYFIPKIDGTPEEDFAGAFGAVVDGVPTEVVLRFDASVKPYILRIKWHSSQQEKELKDGRLELRFTVNGVDGIRPWLYRWLPYVEVAAPNELKAICKDELDAALKRI